jgi:protocatechuate 3,4-dioxygenase beta subunit
LGLVRSDIAELRAGTPLTLRFTVVMAATCRPIVGANVDVWQCDALGVYSGVPAPASGDEAGSSPPSQTIPPAQSGTGTFLRGIVKTDGAGVATFQTLYPGWYPGRTPHIHVKVRLDDTPVHTGQCYFDDALTDAVYQAAPYNSHTGRDTTNATDHIYQRGGAESMLTVISAPGAGYVASMTLAIAGASGRDSRL